MAKEKVVEKKETFEQKRMREEQEKLQSDAISKLYKNKNAFDNSKNTRRG
jgi:hypothetical protein